MEISLVKSKNPPLHLAFKKFSKLSVFRAFIHLFIQ